MYNHGMATTEDRLTRLEAVYEHLATKADVAGVRAEIADLRAEFKADIGELKADLTKWMIGTQLAFASIVIGGIAIILRFID